MKRWVVGAAAGAALAGAFGALAWMSAQLTRLEGSETAARRDAAREQAANLALWRMDLALARLVAEEGVRPIADYRRSEVPDHPHPQVLLHFDVDPFGEPFSPEVAARVAPASRLAELRVHLGGLSLGSAVRTQALARNQLVTSPLQGGGPTDEQLRNVFANQNAAIPPGPAEAIEKMEEALTPIWAGEALLLVRRARAEGRGHLVGCWVDWPSVRDGLLASVRDLLPQARLEPVREPGAQPPHMLASIPVRLLPGEPADLPAAGRSARRGLAVAWVALGLAALALGSLVVGAIALGERRATFASAVTHELRTPLTTFRMYAEMLEGGMVAPGEVGSYLATLRSEAERLTHLVENVLAWSRLERGRFTEPRDAVDVRALLERELPRMSEWARRSGMVLEMAAGEGLAARGEPTAIGQILFNLVDNACKHASSAADRRIEVAARADGEWVRLAVRDHGPGVKGRAGRRLFKSFAKGAADAALSAPGIGLGLPLSRRLARAMGGDLTLARPDGAGARFELKLPRA